jgi:phage-related protein
MGDEHAPGPKIVRWVGSSKDDVSNFPDDVRDEVGQTLWEIQCGDTPANTKQMHGKVREVREIVVDDDGETYRTMYLTRLGNYVYVLDAFLKKAKKGIATPKIDLDRVEQRLKIAKEHHEKHP